MVNKYLNHGSTTSCYANGRLMEAGPAVAQRPSGNSAAGAGMVVPVQGRRVSPPSSSAAIQFPRGSLQYDKYET